MNHQTIIDLAIAEGLTFIPEANCPLARIVRKAVAMEREECAKVCDELVIACAGNSALTTLQCSEAIRARSTA